MNSPLRYTAIICLETRTPLSVGSGLAGLTNDRLVARDANALPCIPGSGLAGVLRHALAERGEGALSEKLFGRIGSKEAKDSEGSRVILSTAHLVMLNGAVADGLVAPHIATTEAYSRLPNRDHVRINEYGVADTEQRGKYEEELAWRGSRFVFSLELIGDESYKDSWATLLNILHTPYFRVGGGTRKGFGAFSIVALDEAVYDLRQKEATGETQGILSYLARDSRLRMPKGESREPQPGEVYAHYRLDLNARNFFFFGGQEVDMNQATLAKMKGSDAATSLKAEDFQGVDDTYKTEQEIEWTPTGTGQLSEKRKALIPATSVKGALSHRLAFHYNSILRKRNEEARQNNSEEQIAEQLMADLEELERIPEGTAANSDFWGDRMRLVEALSWPEEAIAETGDYQKTGEQNTAVATLFGVAAGTLDAKRGSVLLEDFYIEKFQEKIFDHVKIDRYTGGASNGALFQEKTISSTEILTLNLYVSTNALNGDENIKHAWHRTLRDLAETRLALGGKTTKGHGLFAGSVSLNNQPLPNDEPNDNSN